MSFNSSKDKGTALCGNKQPLHNLNKNNKFKKSNKQPAYNLNDNDNKNNYMRRSTSIMVIKVSANGIKHYIKQSTKFPNPLI